VDAKTTREDVVRTAAAALPALLPIVVITARPPPKGGPDGGLKSNISALFVVVWKT
jgi:hypothetical protein